MLMETRYFTLELPLGFVVQPPLPPRACASYVHAQDHREITLATIIAREEVGVDEALRQLAEQRLEVLRRNGAAEHHLPIGFSDGNDLRMASFVAVGRDPIVSFCANITHEHAVKGQRCIAMFCMYQYFRLGAGAPDVVAFENFARSVADTVRPRVP